MVAGILSRKLLQKKDTDIPNDKKKRKRWLQIDTYHKRDVTERASESL